jgi:hypothetical protein
MTSTNSYLLETLEPASNSGRKTFKKSSLRQSITFDNESSGHSDPTIIAVGGEEYNPASSELSRPSIGRSDSSRRKKKAVKSRLSFGPGEIISGDAAEALENDELFTPKKVNLGKRFIENNALRKTLPAYQIPIRASDDDEERPTYSKDYLNELKSSTPSTPKDLHSHPESIDLEDSLDELELAGAVIVDSGEYLASPVTIFTDAEIREKKERRARLAKEQDFISLDDPGDNRREISLLPRKNKAESRLVREDEDLGEGFDEFVDDGRIALGKKQEREQKRKQRKEMAAMIHEAEGSSSDASNDSERDRQDAYEAAQTRAGMDGLSKTETATTSQIPPKITPIPNLSDCLERLQTTLSGMEQELARRTKKMNELQGEKKEILAREQEVQRLLKEAGDRYSAMRSDTGLPALDPTALLEGQNALPDPLLANRGLESFGNTPVGRPQVEDVG